jgi:hypothetical protein
MPPLGVGLVALDPPSRHFIERLNTPKESDSRAEFVGDSVIPSRPERLKPLNPFGFLGLLLGAVGLLLRQAFAIANLAEFRFQLRRNFFCVNLL